MKKKLFAYVLGNPPYNEDFEKSGDNGKYAAPVYNYFLDAACKVAEKVELIHPARFLFNAGSTSKAWNEQKLNDPHFKVLKYEADSSKYFADTDIKGGIAITYYDDKKEFEPIETFIPYKELKTISQKVLSHPDYNSFQQIVYSRTIYRLTDAMHEEHPEAINMQSKGHPYDMSSNIFSVLPQLFFDEKPDDGNEYIQLFGRAGTTRVYKWIQKKYVNEPENFNKWKIFVPQADGNGTLGEVLTTPVIGQPVLGHTETFISIGSFDTEYEVNNCLKYVKTKFCRVIRGILKVTQHNSPEKWKYVPLQDFTQSSDIDWSKSIPEIDAQLYKKYRLDKSEIEFIETHVKEMA